MLSPPRDSHHFSRLRWWLPALLMMALIFVAATDLGAMSHQSRLLAPFLRWLGLDDAAATAAVVFVRKNAHFFFYGILSILVWRAWLRRRLLAARSPWPARAAWGPLVFCAVYAVTDEWHQSFVPSRTAAVGDVVLDTAGAACALAAWWLWQRRNAVVASAAPGSEAPKN